MAVDKLVDSNLLDAACTYEAGKIREKLGSSAQISYDLANGKGFGDAIEAIETGGGGDDAVYYPNNDVCFYDYDGKIVYDYTASEFLALSAMPANPSHDGLVAQGWNWTLSEAQDYVQNYGALDVGQNYTTTDEKTHLFITLEGAHLSPTLYLNQSSANGANVDWGDGSPIETVSGTGNVSITHTYAEPGDYIIRVGVSSGNVYFGQGSQQTRTFGSGWYGNILTAIEMCQSTKANQYAFISVNLKTVSVSTGFPLAGYAFYRCTALQSITLPRSVTSFASNALCLECTHMNSAIMPPTLTRYPNFAPFQNTNIKRLTLPPTPTNLYAGPFALCRQLKTIIIPNTIVSLTGLNGSFALKTITIPASVTGISANTFQDCQLLEVHLKGETPPTLANANAFNNNNGQIVFYVPYSSDHSILDAYKTATNWSTFASYMQEETQ